MAINLIVSSVLKFLEDELGNFEPIIQEFLKDELDAIGKLLLEYLTEKLLKKGS